MVWFSLFSQVINPNYFEWNVMDSAYLAKIGQEFSDYKKIPVNFLNSVSQNDSYDVLFINTSVQYVEDYKDLFISLFVLKPRYIVLTRFLRSDSSTVILRQRVHGFYTPCVIISECDFISFLNENGYLLIANSTNEDESESLYDSLPLSARKIVGKSISKNYFFSFIYN